MSSFRRKTGGGTFNPNDENIYFIAADVQTATEGLHTCMVMRGIKTPGTMKTIQFSGKFEEEPHLQAQFLSMVNGRELQLRTNQTWRIVMPLPTNPYRFPKGRLNRRCGFPDNNPIAAPFTVLDRNGRHLQILRATLPEKGDEVTVSYRHLLKTKTVTGTVTHRHCDNGSWSVYLNIEKEN